MKRVAERRSGLTAVFSMEIPIGFHSLSVPMKAKHSHLFVVTTSAAKKKNVTAIKEGTAMKSRRFAGFLIGILILVFSTSGMAAAAEIIRIMDPVVRSVFPDVGPGKGGTWIRITGAYFMQGAEVKIGTNSATRVAVISSNKIVAQTPPGGRGTYDVVVINLRPF